MFIKPDWYHGLTTSIGAKFKTSMSRFRYKHNNSLYWRNVDHMHGALRLDVRTTSSTEYNLTIYAPNVFGTVVSDTHRNY